MNKGFLHPQESGWHLPQGEPFPEPRQDETVVFALFYERGFELPVHPFLRALLHYYQLELQHLNPNGLLRITTFITFYECFLGVQANFLPWMYFFTVYIESYLG